MPLLRGTRYSVISAGKWLPTRISGLQLWLKADAGLWQDSVGGTPAVADGDVVGVWEDQSGNSNDASQATTSKKPLLKLAIQNGKPVVRFDANDDALVTAAFASELTQPNTVVIALHVAPANAEKTDMAVDGITSTKRHAVHVSATDVFGIHAGTTLESSATLDAWHISSFIVNGVSSEIYTDGAFDNSGDMGTQGLTGVMVGNFHNLTSSYTGDIAEILIYSSALSAADRGALEAYLNARYAVY